MAYFDLSENHSGSISNRLSSEALSIQELLGARLGVICEAMATLGFGILLGFVFSWELTLIVFAYIICMFLLAFFQIRWQARLNKCSEHILGQASALAAEVLHNMRTVKQLSIEYEILQQFSYLVNQAFTVRRNDIVISGLLRSIYWGSQTFFLYILYWIVLVRLKSNEMDDKDTLMVFAFVVFAFETLRFIVTLTRQMGSSLSAARGFFDLFDRTPTIDNGSVDGRQLENFQGQIEFNQVEFSYPSRPTIRVLNKFQLTIEPGQWVALVGRSGCGKSTVIQLLQRFYDVTHGKVCLDGVDIRDLNIHWLRSQFSLANQEPILFDMTIAENIAYGKVNPSLEDIIEAATKANIHQFVISLPQGYETRVGAKGSHLSGGQKQRIVIARALFRQPKVLLLDEATSAMDSYNEQIVQRALVQAQTEDPNRTSLTIAHRLSTIHSCDVIHVLSKGHIEESGTHTELMQKHGLYYHMYVQTTIE
ncbi:unnamed protein product [Rotaria magnacalcarata]